MASTYTFDVFSSLDGFGGADSSARRNPPRTVSPWERANHRRRMDSPALIVVRLPAYRNARCQRATDVL